MMMMSKYETYPLLNLSLNSRITITSILSVSIYLHLHHHHRQDYHNYLNHHHEYYHNGISPILSQSRSVKSFLAAWGCRPGVIAQDLACAQWGKEAERETNCKRQWKDQEGCVRGWYVKVYIERYGAVLWLLTSCQWPPRTHNIYQYGSVNN